ncbi:nitroreductase family protein [Paenibacillus chibensis]|uniref:Nitroreductase family protein n=1 Tax=Paenibacillus chibensis TaxID=59846 RepID=A0ABU6Q0P5_9BACL|nr:nitroreductase family protein [Paenibacillus chibensis]MEC0370457.1 nitroreductase family protein [Paenibacillus chibensis]MED5020694.1 nitroreductase family protein [Paenibacillus chibensis]
MSDEFFSALKGRRSIYAISKNVSVSDDKIQEIVNEAVKHTPSAFNSQSARVVVLLGEQHDKFWNLTEGTLKAVVPAENFQSTADKMAGFRSGYGTVLFFEDNAVIEGLQSQFELYKDNFPIWSQQSSGMLQLVIWTALEAEGLGASLQHYNPLIDQKVANEWNLPASWRLMAQMPFGNVEAPAGEKQFQPLEDRIKVFK